MKYCIEFGVRGGAHTDNVILPTRALAERMAHCLTITFENDGNATAMRDWMFCKGEVRKTWKTATHFVAISKLDGVARGSASASLWRKPSDGEVTRGSVCTYTRNQSQLA